MMDGWFYTGKEEDEKWIYNWRFDYEEAHDLEPVWSRLFGGWDAAPPDDYLLDLVNGEYGQTIEAYLRKHSQEGPIESMLLFLPPENYAVDMRAYPSGAWKKEMNRVRRANASRWKKTVWRQIEEALRRHDEAAAAKKPRPQKHWRPEKL